MIALKDIYRSYELPKITVEVLKGINLEAEQGDFIAIMGPSGSGKSTLLNILGCLDRPTSGRYLLDNVDVSTKNDNELAEIRNRSIGFVFQSFNLLPRFPAWKNVELPLLYGGVEPGMRRQKAVEMLTRMGLGDRSDHKPSELSGGEQQRVAIARALINSPVIILADEPTGNLDSKVGREIMEIFAGLNRGGVTIILVTHEMEIAGFAKRIITMRDGVCYSGCA
ncbi:MAG: ABC transporter ATP-binding protein [Nitrospirae bacterium]|nr:ABC transporter ATP-binding protein [Nitrospirota bacterium]